MNKAWGTQTHTCLMTVTEDIFTLQNEKNAKSAKVIMATLINSTALLFYLMSSEWAGVFVSKGSSALTTICA